MATADDGRHNPPAPALRRAGRVVVAAIGLFAIAAAAGCGKCSWLRRHGMDRPQLTRALVLVKPIRAAVGAVRYRWADLEFSLPTGMRWVGRPKLLRMRKGEWRGRSQHVVRFAAAGVSGQRRWLLRVSYFPMLPMIADVVREFDLRSLRACVPHTRAFLASFKSVLDVWNQTYTLTPADARIANCRKGRARGLFWLKFLSGAEWCPFRLDTARLHAYLAYRRDGHRFWYAELFNTQGSLCGDFELDSWGKHRIPPRLLMRYCVEILSTAELVPYGPLPAAKTRAGRLPGTPPAGTGMGHPRE